MLVMGNQVTGVTSTFVKHEPDGAAMSLTIGGYC